MKNRPPFIQALTFDDVLLVPQESHVLPREINIKTRLTNKINMNININPWGQKIGLYIFWAFKNS